MISAYCHMWCTMYQESGQIAGPNLTTVIIFETDLHMVCGHLHPIVLSSYLQHFQCLLYMEARIGQPQHMEWEHLLPGWGSHRLFCSCHAMHMMISPTVSPGRLICFSPSCHSWKPTTDPDLSQLEWILGGLILNPWEPSPRVCTFLVLHQPLCCILWGLEEFSSFKVQLLEMWLPLWSQLPVALYVPDF